MISEREQIIDLTKKLVEIPSITKREDKAIEVLDLVNEFLPQDCDLAQHTFLHKGTVSRIWGDKDTLNTPKLLLSGHIDVVDASDDMFKPKIENGRMTGRGTGDMKGHVAAMLVAYKRWLDENKNSKDVGLILTSDEEVGGFDGARYAIEKAELRPTTVFIPDGEFNFDIVDSQKAPHHFHIRAVSKDGGGHVSKAFKIDNPVNRILSVYSSMRKKYALASPDDEWKSTFEMTVFKTGNGIEGQQSQNGANQIPEWAEAWLGWRWPLEVDVDGEKPTYQSGLTDLQKFSQEFGVEILTDDHGFGEGCYTNPNADFVQKWKGIIEPIIGKEVGFQHMHGATDGRHFYKYGAQVLVTSAITDGAHSDHEWVDIDSLVHLSEAIYKYQKEMLK